MKIIAVTGPDASGKDSQLQLYAEYLRSLGRNVYVCSIWDSFADLVELKEVRNVLDAILLRFEPNARSLFLQSALRNSLAKIPEGVEILLLNGYIYKYWATEIIYGANPEVWSDLPAALFPEPEGIIYLDTPLEVCFSRRSKWSPYERGTARAVATTPFELRTFQSRVHVELRKILSARPGVMRIDGAGTIDEIQARIRADVRL